ncbi:hypothetical protein AQUCO_06600004v1 [Aquilegia coerulea]|uniref:Uncharacterized protein n=1 Tax=Aquilegia coerulea TaxID=218851 RepID=A0A2G5CBZ2_AQUCA|nr:hypothetical protein AQUCO_06600004v1 [Aquilegia coerulea]
MGIIEFVFLGAHFVWAFNLMFLFNGRDYWQELIESIVWAHNKLKVAPAIQPRVCFPSPLEKHFGFFFAKLCSISYVAFPPRSFCC